MRLRPAGMLLLLALGACGGTPPFAKRPAPPPPVSLEQLTVDGLARTYRTYAPISWDRTRPAPLMLVLGGVGNSAEDMVAATDFDRLAEDEQVVVAYADGLNRTWNAGYCCLGRAPSGPDDVAFLTRLIDQVQASHPIDADRVFVVGVSAGAMMAYRMGCEVADRVTGVGSVAGAMVLDACQPSRPVSVIEIHGTDDGLVPYDGGRTAGGATQPSPPTPAVTQRWAELNGCPRSAIEASQGPVTTATWTGCAGGTGVKLITIAGGGHTWFATGFGPADGAVDASAELWSFFTGLAGRNG